MYPPQSRIRYRDQIDGPTGVVLSVGEEGGERWYETQWSDYKDRVFHHTAHFIETAFEIY